MGQRDRDLPTPSIPRDAAELGAGLRALRVRSLRELEREQEAAGGLVISKSQLARYEDGSTLPPLKHHEHLDRLYGGTGWVSVAVRSLRRGDWDPWGDDDWFLARVHAGIWPAEYRSDVWMKVKPTSDAVRLPHLLSLSWGPWRCGVPCTPGPEGVLLVTGKSRDERAVPLNLVSDRRVFVLFGAGDEVDGDETVIDIRHLWSDV